MSQRAELPGCARVREQLDAWVDGELESADAAMVEIHLERCESCRAEHRLADQVVEGLRDLPEFAVPERVVEAVRRGTQSTTVEWWRTVMERIAFRPARVVAAVVVIAVMAVAATTWRNRREARFSDPEVARTVAETRLALEFVGVAARRAELRLRERTLGNESVVRTVNAVRRSVQRIGATGVRSDGRPTVPDIHQEGS